MDFLSLDVYGYLCLRFPVTVFLGDGWGGEKSYGSHTLRWMVVLQLLGVMCGGFSLRWVPTLNSIFSVAYGIHSPFSILVAARINVLHRKLT